MTDYCTVAEIKAILPDVSYGTSYDALLGVLATRASRMIDRYTKRDAGAYATGTAGTVRYYDGSGTSVQLVDEMAAAPSAVEVDEVGDHTYTAWTTTDYILRPYNQPPYTRMDVDLLAGTKAVWYRFPKSIKITAAFGHSTTVPEDIKQAAIITAVRYFQRGKQGFEDVGAISELGQLKYVKQIDPDVAQILDEGGYVRMVI